MALSLTPRYDLFRFIFPKTFLPKEVHDKYSKILNTNAGVLTTPIDYLNESVQAVHIPGISNIVTEQAQHSSNPIQETEQIGDNLGRINVEPNHTTVYTSASNPIESIDKELKITFRMNQGLYNYYMIYETIFNHYLKWINMSRDSLFYIEVLNDVGEVCERITFYGLHIDGIDGLDFDYNKIERESGTFDVVFKFNNIEFEFLPHIANNDYSTLEQTPQESQTSYLYNRYYGEVNEINSVTQTIIKSLNGDNEEEVDFISNKIPANKYFLYAFRGDVDMVCLHASSGWEIDDCVNGNVLLTDGATGKNVNYSYIFVPASTTEWTLKISEN